LNLKNVRLKGGFGQVSCVVTRDPELNLRDKGFYSYLASYADSQTNELFVGTNKMANECGITVSTVKRCLDKLKRKGIIDRRSNGKNKTMTTVILK
jgi:DNA-binding MarR family transcriptional regulator